jgi:hypothetical protein
MATYGSRCTGEFNSPAAKGRENLPPDSNHRCHRWNAVSPKVAPQTLLYPLA